MGPRLDAWVCKPETTLAFLSKLRGVGSGMGGNGDLPTLAAHIM